jgi:hypothetical protein
MLVPTQLPALDGLVDTLVPTVQTRSMEPDEVHRLLLPAAEAANVGLRDGGCGRFGYA